MIFIFRKEEDLNAYEVEYYKDETVSINTLDPDLEEMREFSPSELENFKKTLKIVID